MPGCGAWVEVAVIDNLNKLCKWRSVLAGWHNGTKTLNSPGTSAMRDLMDKWLIMRAEGSAIAALLVRKGIFSGEEFTDQVMAEAAILDRQLETVFPGFRTTENGVSIDLAVAQETMRKKNFPP
jgi:hypothetical protein